MWQIRNIKKIKIVYEKNLLGTAGSLKNNIDYFENSNGILIYADNFTTTKLNEFISDSLMMPENCIISMLTFECAKPSQAGIVKVNKRNVMIDFNEKPTNSESKLANAGIFYMTSKFINNIKLIKRPVNDFSIDIIPKLKNKIFCIKTEEIFYDIGTIENYELVNF